MPVPVLQPDIYLGDLRVAEPVIAFTSVLVAAVCAYAWLRLWRQRERSPDIRLMAVFFLLMAVSTLIGGLVGHAFLYRFTLVWKLPGWLLGMVATAVLGQVAILHARPLLKPGWSRIFSAVNLGVLLAAMAVVAARLNFHLVEAHAAF